MFAPIINTCKTVIQRIKNKIKQMTKPTTPSLIIGAISALPKSKAENPRWGAKKIQGELLKLEIYVHKRTIKWHRVQLCRLRPFPSPA